MTFVCNSLLFQPLGKLICLENCPPLCHIWLPVSCGCTWHPRLKLVFSRMLYRVHSIVVFIHIIFDNLIKLCQLPTDCVIQIGQLLFVYGFPHTYLIVVIRIMVVYPHAIRKDPPYCVTQIEKHYCHVFLGTV